MRFTPSLGWPKRSLGLDIGAAALRVVELRRCGRQGWRLERCAQHPLPEGAVFEGAIEQLEAVAAALSQLLRTSGVRSRQVVMALPSRQVMIRRLQLPADVGIDRHAALLLPPVQAELAALAALAGGSVQELAVDVRLLEPVGTVPTDGSAASAEAVQQPDMGLEVLLAAARRDRVQDRVDVAEAAGLEPVVVEMESNAVHLALQAWLAHSGRMAPGHTLALAELGADSMVLQVVRGPVVLFHREVAGRMGMPQACAELGRLLQLFQASSPGPRPDALALAGGFAAVDDVCRSLSDRLGVPAFAIDPFEGLQPGPQTAQAVSPARRSEYLRACGLALRCCS